MDIDSKVYRIAAARVAINVSLGILPLLLLALTMPGIHPGQTLSLWLCLAVTIIISQVIAMDAEPQPAAPPFGFLRITSCLLLGTSLMAIFWKAHAFPHAFQIMVSSFCIRWLLYFIETRELHRADHKREPLPSVATRIRRGITFITGGAIPALIFLGAPAVPSLSLSFILTALSQWAISCEAIRNQASPTQIMHHPAENERHSSIR